MSAEIEEIKAKVDIVELISGYIKLTPAGANQRALCPFHNEKTPSFMVNPAKQIWRCFGCGEGGDIFSFLMKIEGLEFYDALKVLAQKAGVKLERANPSEESAKSRLYDLSDLAARYWHKVLLESSAAEFARDYLKQRGISEETIDDFRLGYAVDSWDDLNKFLSKKGYREDEIFLAGLAVRKEKGTGFYDRFRGRLMFPIIDLSGRTVGFGGRILNQGGGSQSNDASSGSASPNPTGPAKYINTPQTAIYNKSLVLYGLYQARQEIKKEDLCVLVEGYMDVLPSHQMGVKNVAAISGTALTLEQVKVIKRYTSNLALSLDMDSAGRLAAERSIEVALQAEMNVKVISLPFGKDPGECIKNNPADWPPAIKNAESIMEYFFGRATSGKNLNDPKDKKEVVKLLLNKVIKIGNPVEQDYWLKRIAQKLSVSEGVLRELAAKAGAGEKPAGRVAPPGAANFRKTPEKEVTAFKTMMALVLVFPGYLPALINDLALDSLGHRLSRDLYKNLSLFYTGNTGLFEDWAVDKKGFDLFDPFKKYLADHDAGPEADELLTDSYLLAQNEFLDVEASLAKSELGSLVRFLKAESLERQISQLQSELEQAEKEAAGGKVDEICQKLNDLIKQKGIINN